MRPPGYLLAEYLLKHRTPAELARELAAQAQENAALKDRVYSLEVELFWMHAAERDASLPTRQPGATP